jgi:hypothetical protein
MIKKMLYFFVNKRDNNFVNGDWPRSEKGNDMEFKVTISCPDCDGYGQVCLGHPNDPSVKEVDCFACDGSGEKSFTEVYDSIADAAEDYPGARFTYL